MTMVPNWIGSQIEVSSVPQRQPGGVKQYIEAADEAFGVHARLA